MLFWRNKINFLFSQRHRHFQFENGIIHSNTLLSYHSVFFMQWNTVNEINRGVIRTPKTEDDAEANSSTSAVTNRSAAMNCQDQ